VYGNRTTERTEDYGPWWGGRERRGLSGSLDSVAVNLSGGSMRQYTVVYGNKTTESQSAQRTTDLGGSQGEKRIERLGEFCGC